MNGWIEKRGRKGGRERDREVNIQVKERTFPEKEGFWLLVT